MANQWPAKVCSVAIAIMLVVFHRMSVLESRFFSTPLLLEINEGLTPASSYPRMVRVSLRGEANSIYPILEEDIETYLDLKKYNQEGSYRVPIQIRKKGTAMGVEPLEINVDPMEVTLDLDQKIGKYVLLTPNVQGYPEEGYELVSYTLIPNQVMVEGPLRLVTNLTELTTEIIDIGERSDDFAATVHIMNRDPLLVIRGEGVAEFQGLIKQLIMIRSFSDFVIELRGLDPQFSVNMDIRTGGIRLEGPQRQLAPFEPRDITLFVDCSSITRPGDFSLPVQVRGVPAPFTLIRSEPSQVNLRVSASLNSSSNGGFEEAAL